MKISVAVPSFNYAQYLRACLESIRMQDHTDFEVLIADGGSTDGSLDIIGEFCRDDSRFRLVSRSDSGQPDAAAKALDMACGEIQCFLNADDLYLSDTVFTRVVRSFEAYRGVSIISAGGYYVNDSGQYIKPVRLRYHPLDNVGWMKYRVACLQPATFWKKEVYQEIGFQKEFHFSFDSVFFYDAYLKYSWLELGDAVAGYRLHGGNKSLMIRPGRVAELARFEQYKFGKYSLRAAYLFLLAGVVAVLCNLPLAGQRLCRLLYLAVNSLAFLSAYRLPGI